MGIKNFCNTDVVVCDAETPVPEVAKLMRTHHVGDVVVIEEREEKRIPLGIVTDRDIVLEAVALGLDIGVFTAGDLASTPVVTVRTEESMLETLRTMSRHRVRRIAVVDEDEALYGIISADDLLRVLADELLLLTTAISEQPIKESRTRR
ncbi:MAG TPA: CBS domain-containing protein [Noviherbaspirillum sp.]